MAMRSPNPEQPHRPIRDLLRRLIKAPAALSVVWPVLLIVGGYIAWQRPFAENGPVAGVLNEIIVDEDRQMSGQ